MVLYIVFVCCLVTLKPCNYSHLNVVASTAFNEGVRLRLFSVCNEITRSGYAGRWLVTRAVAAAARAARGLCIICAGRRRRHQSGRSGGQALGFAGRTREAAN